MHNKLAALSATLVLMACGNPSPPSPPPPPAEPEPASTPIGAAAERLELHVFNCGTIEVSDLDVFSTAGDYAGTNDLFTNSCFLVRHPEGDLLWDAGLPGILAATDAQEQGVFTVSLDTTLTEHLRERGLTPADVDYLSISHSHFDHVGQVDQFTGAKWLVHESELAAMFPPDTVDGAAETGAQFTAFGDFERQVFTGELDVFGDGRVVIFPTPGHTPGHTSLQVTLEDTGTVLLTGDLYHRAESRELKRVPRFNFDEAQTQASMDAFEARAEALNALVIIQHEPGDVFPLADVLR
ncbi:MAG: N-acyl homoserine lactonase family protein [Pseudomonadota bacterium]